jgi:hypothetical protein
MTRQNGFHEDYQQSNEVRAGSDRAFGIVFAIVFTIVGAWPLLGDAPLRLWALGLAGVFLATALIAPNILKPLNQVWFRFGMLLHKVVNPLVMGLLFFTTVTPIALIMRMMGKDPLNRKIDRQASTYWIERDPAGPAPDTMKNQF